MPRMLVSAQRPGPKKATDAISNVGLLSQTNVGVGIFATNTRYFQQLSSVRRHMSSHPQHFRIYFQSLPRIQGYMYQQYIRHNVTPHKELLDAVTLGLPGLTALLS
jgi:DNA topoisomerase IB